MLRILNLIACVGIALSFRVKPRNRIQVKTQVVEVPGRACNGSGALKAQVYYQQKCNTRSCPIFAFAHGSTFGERGNTQDLALPYKALLEQVAAAGYFVVAPMRCHDSFKGGDFELLDAVQWLRQNSVPRFPTDYHVPSTVAGHGGGAWAALAAASNSTAVHNAYVGLAFALHPTTWGQQGPTVPTVYWTGDADEQASSSNVKALYDEAPTDSERAFAVLEGKGHDAPTSDPTVYVNWMLRWMDCKIRGDEAACAAASEMCGSEDFTTCEASSSR